MTDLPLRRNVAITELKDWPEMVGGPMHGEHRAVPSDRRHLVAVAPATAVGGPFEFTPHPATTVYERVRVAKSAEREVDLDLDWWERYIYEAAGWATTELEVYFIARSVWVHESTGRHQLDAAAYFTAREDDYLAMWARPLPDCRSWEGSSRNAKGTLWAYTSRT